MARSATKIQSIATTETMGVFMSMDLTAKSPEAALSNAPEKSRRNRGLAEPPGLLRNGRKRCLERSTARRRRRARSYSRITVRVPLLSLYMSAPVNTVASASLKRTSAGKLCGTHPMKHDVRPYVRDGPSRSVSTRTVKDKALIPGGYLHIDCRVRILHAPISRSIRGQRKPQIHGYRELPVPRP